MRLVSIIGGCLASLSRLDWLGLAVGPGAVTFSFCPMGGL